MKSSLALIFAFLLIGGAGVVGCDSGSSDKEEADAAGGVGETDTSGEEGCVPACDGKSCGDDGCGGTCGSCFTREGAPSPDLCQPDGTCTVCGCGDKECGVDDCGSPCGTCPDNHQCGDDSMCAFDTGSCSFEGFAHVEQGAKLKSGDGFFFSYRSTQELDGNSQNLFLRIDTRDGMGGPAAPGEFEAAFGSFAEGGLWLYGEETTDDGLMTYVPVSGKIVLDSFSPDGGLFKATLDGVVLQEAVVEEGVVTPTAYGGFWCMDGVVLEAEIAVTPDVCGSLAVGKTIGNTIGNFQLQRCDGEWVDLYEYCGSVAALWIVATNGW